MMAPFRVKRAGPGTWQIVDARGETVRLGYVDKRTANAVCEVMNRAAALAHSDTQSAERSD